jgi:hypothetical protein
MAFSVPPEFEVQILKHAKAEHRTVSEYLREAVRQYMIYQDFESTQKTVSKRLKDKGLKVADVESVVENLRKKS